MISVGTDQLTAMIHEVGRNLSYVEQNIVNLQMLQQIEHLQDEIEKILDNIQSAQLGLMSRNILTRTEINKLSISSSELQHLKTDVFCTTKTILFALRLPNFELPQSTYFIKKIPTKENLILQIPEGKAVRLENKLYHYNIEKSECKLYKCISDKSICKLAIVSGESSVEEIFSGVILAKNFTTLLVHNCNEKKLLFD